VLFGLLRDADDNVVGPDSVHYANLGVGETIGGPFEDTTGPALNNFIKFVAVFAFVTGGPGRLYDELPLKTWPYGFVSVFCSIGMVAFTKVGLNLCLQAVTRFIARQTEIRDYEEGNVEVEPDEDDDWEAA